MGLQKASRWAAAALLAVFMAVQNAAAQHDVQAPWIGEIIEQSEASDAFWSVVLRDSSGRLLEGYNTGKLVRPASNVKLLTSAAILEELGPEFSYTTRVYGLGEMRGDTWEGDLVIRGSGDPSISGTFYGEDRFHVFDKFYEALDSLGIRKIEGNLIGNDSYFDEQPYPEGWSWEDLTFYYGVEISALSFNNNAVDLEVFADRKVGEAPRIQWFPFDTDYVTFINDQIITPPESEYDEYYRRIPGTNTIVLRSKLPLHYKEEESLSIKNAPLFFMDTFREYLEDGGIEVSGRIIIDHQPRDWDHSRYRVLASHSSVPLRMLIQEVNKESNNFYTEMLLKTASAEAHDAQGSTDLGLRLIEEFAHEMSLDTTRIEMSDGSGMAPSTLISPAALTRLLADMQGKDYFQDYKNSLAIAGRDGSLENRFRGSPVSGRLHGKTGYVSGVRALSGYLETRSNRIIIFTVVTNNYTEKTSYIDSVHETIVNRIYRKY